MLGCARSYVVITFRSVSDLLHQNIPRDLFCTGGSSSNDLGVDGVGTGVLELVTADVLVTDLDCWPPGKAEERSEPEEE